MEKVQVAIFSYRIPDILDEVTKRTSYFGKMRNTDKEPHLLDRLSLTEGEDFLFTEFLEDAAAQTYDWLKVFGRNIQDAKQIVKDYTDRVEYPNCGLYAEMSGVEIPIGEAFTVPVSAVTSGDTITVSTVDPIIIGSKTSTIYRYYARFNIRTVLDGLKCSEEYTIDSGILTVSGNNLNTIYSYTIPFDFDEDGSRHVLVGVDFSITIEAIQPSTLESIGKDTYIECPDSVGNTTVYQALEDCTNANWLGHSKKVVYDARGCVMFVLERHEHFDNNQLSSVDRNIKEALVNYIIYRWFEYTNAPESSVFFDKFENYAQQAKIGMDSEKFILQRRYNISR